MTGKINTEWLTKCICHKGFSGYSIDVASSNFRISGQETDPQSFTEHILKPCGQIILRPKHMDNYDRKTD